MKRFLSSYLTLFFLGLIAVVAINLFHEMNLKIPGTVAPTVQGFFFLITMAFWIRDDAAKRRISFPADLAMLNSYVAIIYFFHSRSWKGCWIPALIILLLIGYGIVVAASRFPAL